VTEVLPPTAKLDERLPLVQDDSGAWIPIEMLCLDGPQPLTRYGHLNTDVHDSIISFMKQHGTAKMFKIAAEFLQKGSPNGSENVSFHFPSLIKTCFHQAYRKSPLRNSSRPTG
jgi:hypothetical protein